MGAEVSIGSFLINYFNQPEIGNLPEVEGAKLVAYYWGGAMVGRLHRLGHLQKLKPAIVLGVAAFSACTLVIISMLTTGHIAVGSILLVGFFTSSVSEYLLRLASPKLGPRTGDGSGLLFMAIVGGAIIPLVQGVIADHIGVHQAFVLPVICYLYNRLLRPKGLTSRRCRSGSVECHRTEKIRSKNLYVRIEAAEHALVQRLGFTNPFQCSIFLMKGLVAQRLEQRTHNPLVPGSNPGGPTNIF